MKIHRVRLQGFRCYKDEVALDVDDLTVLIGRNDIGKSTVFDALAIFFGQEKLEDDDVYVHNGRNVDKVRIVVEFCDLPDRPVLDTSHPTTLEDEYLLNDEGFLEIHQTYTKKKTRFGLTETLAYAYHPGQEKVDDLLLLNNSELKRRAEELSVGLTAVDKRVNAEIRAAIWQSVSDLDLQPQLIPLDKADAKKIWGKLQDYLPIFALFRSDRPSSDQDDEAQDPMKAAVREAVDNYETDLQRIAEKVEEEVRQVAEKTVEVLGEFDSSIATGIKPQFGRLGWDRIFKISLTDDADIPLNKRGSGVRRLVLLSFFRAKAEQDLAEQESTTNVIYAIEEPETSQHPANQRVIMETLQDLANRPGHQIMISTHSPLMARLLPFDSWRYIKAANGSRQISSVDVDTYNEVIGSLGMLLNHDVKLFIGVEGGNDINFFVSMASMLNSHGENVPELARLQDSGEIIFIPLGGSGSKLWCDRLEPLQIPEFHLYDSDREQAGDTPHYQDNMDEINARGDGSCALSTNKREMENYVHPDAIRQVARERFPWEIGDIEYEDYDDAPAIVAATIHDARPNVREEDDNDWNSLDPKKQKKKASKVKKWLNKEAILAMDPDMLDEIDPDGEVRGWFGKIGNMLD